MTGRACSGKHAPCHAMLLPARCRTFVTVAAAKRGRGRDDRQASFWFTRLAWSPNGGVHGSAMPPMGDAPVDALDRTGWTCTSSLHDRRKATAGKAILLSGYDRRFGEGQA